jgi:hypothetical protein
LHKPPAGAPKPAAPIARPMPPAAKGKQPPLDLSA